VQRRTPNFEIPLPGAIGQALRRHRATLRGHCAGRPRAGVACARTRM